MPTLPTDLTDMANVVINEATKHGKMIATAESCTGGLISSCLTAVAGSSTAFLCGFVTYANEAKTRLLGVPGDAITEFGAVSDIVAAAMAEGALAHSGADMAVAVTGVAGPGGGSADKPVGLVYLSLAESGTDAVIKRYVFAGTRDDVRRSTVGAALELILDRLREREDDDNQADD
ncbi:MAG: nicotinamide-nucleotide amidohydrolase family protein [Alphaproteobacteria bacterium]|nr:nicotinamide-nucleotide amidohydrolase family protein [Alphaproteobacteria bacterium]